MNRRVFLSGFAAAGASLLPGLSGGLALAQGSVGRIVVDTRPLEARGGRAVAAAIRPRLQASLARALAGRVGRGGPVLTVRVHSVQLASFAGATRSGVPTDYLEGEFVIGGRAEPMLVTQASDVAGAYYAPDNELRRLHAIADSFASWVARRV